jgi:hypothetical protein
MGWKMREQIEEVVIPEVFIVIFMVLLWLPCFVVGLILGFCLVGFKDGVKKINDELR